MSLETRSTSPAGRYAIQVAPWEARMSLWIESPSIVDLAADKTLVSFRDGNWSLDSARWLDESTVAVTLRKYPGNHVPSALEVTINCATGVAKVGATTVDNWRFLESRMDECLQWLSDPSHDRAVGWRKWLAALLGR